MCREEKNDIGVQNLCKEKGQQTSTRNKLVDHFHIVLHIIEDSKFKDSKLKVHTYCSEEALLEKYLNVSEKLKL